MDKETRSGLKTLGCSIGIAIISILLIVSIVLIIQFANEIDTNSKSDNKPSSTVNSNSSYTDYTEPETPKLFSRNANIGDLTLNLYKEGLLEIQYSFIPKKDIKNLQITINIKDDESTVLNTQIKNLGNVIEGNQYFFTVKLTELSLSGFFDANNLTMAVTGGTVSYFS